MASGWYIFAILFARSALPAALAGFEGSAVALIPSGDLAAAASRVDTDAVRPTPDNLLRHEAVVEALQATGPLLPVRFGTVLPGVDSVVAALAERQTALLADLRRVGDKVELGVAVLWSADGANGEEPEGDESRADDLTDAASLGWGTRYLRGRLLALQQEERLRARSTALWRDLGRALGRHALESRHTVLPTPRLALRATYLVDPFQVGAFRQAFEESRAAHPDLRLLLSGPWPPYSFVTPPAGEETPGKSLLASVFQRFSEKAPEETMP